MGRESKTEGMYVYVWRIHPAYSKNHTALQRNYRSSVSCSVVSDSFATPWTAAHQAPLYMGFSKQKYWNRLPFPPAGDLPDPGTGRWVLYQ